jgi:hypothetical protein
VQQHRAALILRELELNPRVDAGNMDAGDLRGQPLITDDEPPLVEQFEPRFPGERGHECIHGDVFVTNL